MNHPETNTHYAKETAECTVKQAPLAEAITQLRIRTSDLEITVQEIKNISAKIHRYEPVPEKSIGDIEPDNGDVTTVEVLRRIDNRLSDVMSVARAVKFHLENLL